MKNVISLFLYLCLLLQVVGLLVFLYGYFPVKKVVPGFAVGEDAPPEPSADNTQDLLNGTKLNNASSIVGLGPTYGRLVIMLIDALRADFVFGDAGRWMPYTRRLLENGQSLNFIAKAHPPTVTMPRIKALATGGIPGFVDVVLNFDSSELQEDNLITQLRHSGRKIIFYGDDTWIRLFPDHFQRTDGTTSFFVTDYTEVDYNVSRHIDSELVNNDWDVMILHYLGLDHIGHLAGPGSPLVQPKLKEMDAIIQKIHTALNKQDAYQEQPSLFVLCGDHGMSDQGSHGGASISETVTPLVMLSSQIKGQKRIDYEKIEEIYQIDIAPTLSLLLGLPIPQNSLGAASPGALHGLPIRMKLHAMQINTHQLAKVYRQNVPSYKSDDNYLMYKRALGAHSEWLRLLADEGKVEIDPKHLGDKVANQYLRAMTGMRGKLASSLSKYDVQALVTGVLLLWMVLLSLLHCHVNRDIMSLEVSTGSLAVFIAFSFGFPTAHFVTCTGPNRSDLLCGIDLLRVFLSLGTYVALIILTGFIIFTTSRKTIVQYYKSLSSKTPLELFLILGTVGHTFSLLSSSFVEEEHQTWYFFMQTINLIILIKYSAEAAHAYYNPSRRKKPWEKAEDSSKGFGGSGLSNRERRRRLRQSSSSECPPETSGESSCESVNPWKFVVLSFICVCVCRILRSWNQTGDKWAHLPDVGDWLVRPEQKMVLSYLVAVSLMLVVIIQWITHQDQFYRVALAGAAIGVYFFRAANGAVHVSGMYENSNNGAKEAQAVYGLFALVIIYTFLWYIYVKMTLHQDNTEHGAYFKTFSSTLPRRVHSILTLVIMLLVRPHNIVAFAMIVLVEYFISMHLVPRMNLSVSAMTLLYVWFGQAGFYFQGNSNSLATVDVSAGYVGLDSYNPGIIGMLMAIATYASPVFWLVGLISVLCEKYVGMQDGEERYIAATYDVCFTLGLSRALPLAIYTVLAAALRYHLFVWSVFSPKLLYEGMCSVITIIFIVLL
ncbi:GPI ethanolamine phosphate transferase 2-like [Lineus longissimus]|uniref:GPI ethanolamine phosphate transferase 2-like n=1 Tax=Lineus longissimus TaxID=88925 RepID=UPI00315DB681